MPSVPTAKMPLALDSMVARNSETERAIFSSYSLRSVTSRTKASVNSWSRDR